MSSEKLKIEVLLAAVDRVTGPFKSIAKSGSETARALKAARDQLKDMNAQQERITAFRKAEKDAAIAENTFKSVQERIRSLKDEIAKVPAPTQAMAKALKDATRESEDLKNRHAALIDKQQRLFTQMKAGGIDTSNLAHHSMELATRQVEASQSVNKLNTAMEVQNQKLHKLHAARAEYNKSMALKDKLGGAGAKALVAGTAINAAAAVPVIAYAKAEDAATQLKIAMMEKGGKVSDQFKEINDLAGQLGNKLPGTTADFQNMMTKLIRQGMPAEAVLGGLGKATAYLAVQLQMMPEAAAEFASELQHATRTTDKDMMGLMDTIQKAFNLGVNQNHMLEGFAKMSPALSIIRKEGSAAAKELAPLLIMAKNSGMAGEAAGNAYRKVFQQSMDKRKIAKGNSALSGTGVVLDFTDGKGEFGGLDKMYQQLEKLKNVNTVQRLAALKKVFGDDAETLQVLSLMIERGASGYAAVQAKMERQADIQERVNAQLGTLKNLWDAATGTFTNALVAFGESISPELHATAKWLGELAEGTQKWAKENPELSATLMTIVKWTGMAALGLGGLLVAYSSIIIPMASLKFAMAYLNLQGFGVAVMFGRLWGAIKWLGGGVVWLGRLFLTNPILLAITLIAAAAYLIYRNWEPIKQFFGDIWEWIKAKFDTTATWFSELPSRFATWGSAIIDGLLLGINSKWESLKATVKELAQMLPEWVTGPLKINSPSRVFAEIGGSTMEGLEQGMLAASTGPLAALNALTRKLTAAGAGMLLGGAALAMPPDAVNLTRTITDRHQAVKLPALPDVVRNVPNISQPEAAIDTRPPIGGGGRTLTEHAHMTLTIHVHAAPGMDETALARQVAAEIQRLDAQRAARGRSRLTDAD